MVGHSWSRERLGLGGSGVAKKERGTERTVPARFGTSSGRRQTGSGFLLAGLSPTPISQPGLPDRVPSL
jgi:hypothetical protein